MANLPDLFQLNRGLLADPFRDFDDVFDRMLSSWSGNRAMAVPQPRMDVEEVENGYLMTFEVPGFKKEDIKIDLKDNILTISAENKEENKGEGVRSRRTSRFSRSFTVPADLNPDEVQASCENGLLEVFVPKSQERQSRSIEIQTGAGLSQRLKAGTKDVGVEGQKDQSNAQKAKAAQAKSGAESRH